MRRLQLVFLLMLSACAAAPPAPQTVPAVFRTGRDARFPAERYLVGVGEGATLEMARRRATASIAGQLKASLHSTDILVAAVRTGEAGEETLLQDIRMESRFDRPEWVQLVDAVAVDDRVHALCVLDRWQSAVLLEAEQEIRRSALRLQLESAGTANDLRRHSDAVAEAGRLARGLVPSLATLAILRGQPAEPLPELQRFADARRDLEDKRRAVALRICVEPANVGGFGSDLADRFGAILAGRGVRTLPCAADGEGAWRLEGRLIAEPRHLKAQSGAFDRFCTVRLDYQLHTEAGLADGGMAGGARNRAGGHDYHQACQASAALLVEELAVGLGLRDAAAR